MADTSWANLDQAKADAIGQLRLAPGDIDEDRIQRKTIEAAGHIADFLDRPEVDADHPAITDVFKLAQLREAHCMLTVELYLRKDAPFGVFDAFDQDGSSYRIGSDPLAGIRRGITAQKAAWGIA